MPLNDNGRAFVAVEDIDDVDAPALSEDALALEYADRHEPSYRYVAKWGQWYRYTGTPSRQSGGKWGQYGHRHRRET